jgi:hypothetical protein
MLSFCSDMRLPTTAHTLRRWRIHEVAPDFHVEDVWALQTPGGADDFGSFVALVRSLDPERDASAPTRALFALRWKIGELFGWDGDDDGLGVRVAALNDRLPADLRGTATGFESSSLPFTPLFETENEWAAETANRTVHGILHLSWVPDGAGGYRGQMAVLVKPNGICGAAYMVAIRPFRYLIVYPAMLRRIERAWQEREAAPALAAA